MKILFQKIIEKFYDDRLYFANSLVVNFPGQYLL